MTNGSTTWWCAGGEPRYRVCEFTNLYFYNGSWYAGVGRGRAASIPAVQVRSQHSYPAAPRAVPASKVSAAKAATHHAGLHLVVEQMWTFNIGHALYDGLYASWVALLRTPRQAADRATNGGQLRFRVLLSSPDIPLTRRLLFHEAVARFGGRGFLRTEALSGWHRFERVVIGAGGKGQRWTNPDLRLTGSGVGAPKRFRNRMYRSFNVVPRRAEPRPSTEMRVVVIDNKRYSSRERSTLKQLVAQYRAAGFRHVRYIEWHTVTAFAAHMALLGQTDVYVSSGGTAMMYAPLLPDGAIFVQLGEWMRRPTDNVSHIFWWEEHMLESAPYLRAIYYPTALRSRGLEAAPLKTLVDSAMRLASAGGAPPAPPLANLSPDGRVFVRACAAARDACEQLLHALRQQPEGAPPGCPLLLLDDHQALEPGPAPPRGSWGLETANTWPGYAVHELGGFSKGSPCLPQAMRTALRAQRAAAGIIGVTAGVGAPAAAGGGGTGCAGPLRRLHDGLTRECNSRDCVFDDVIVAGRLPAGWVLQGNGQARKSILDPTHAFGPACVVYGAGIADDFTFETGLARRCSVHAFDCTVLDVGGRMRADGIHFNNVCIGKASRGAKGKGGGEAAPVYAALQREHAQAYASALRGRSAQPAPPGLGRRLKSAEARLASEMGKRTPSEPMYQRLDVLASKRGHRSIDLLKMDIEGSEWELFETNILQRNGSSHLSQHLGITLPGRRRSILPDQIAFELHSRFVNPQYVLPERVRGRGRAAVNWLFIRLWRLGYRVISKDINEGDPGCCEFVVARLGEEAPASGLRARVGARWRPAIERAC